MGNAYWAWLSPMLVSFEDITSCMKADRYPGTGTILDAWKLGVPLVVVPNTRLLNDHQTELAKHLSKEGYAIWGSTRYVMDSEIIVPSTDSQRREQLQAAINKVDQLEEENQTRWPAHSPDQPDDQTRISLWDIGPSEVQREEVAQMTQG